MQVVSKNMAFILHLLVCRKKQTNKQDKKQKGTVVCINFTLNFCKEVKLIHSSLDF